VVRVQPERLRHSLFQFQFDLNHVLARSESGPVADAEDVRVDGEGLLMESCIEDDVRSLAAHAGQFFQLLASARHLAGVIADQRLRQRKDILGLGVEQADRLDRVPNVFLAKRDHLFRRLHLRKQRPGSDVHARIRRLRRQHHRHQQGVRVHIFEFGLRGGVFLREPAEEFENLVARHRASITSRIV